PRALAAGLVVSARSGQRRPARALSVLEVAGGSGLGRLSPRAVIEPRTRPARGQLLRPAGRQQPGHEDQGSRRHSIPRRKSPSPADRRPYRLAARPGRTFPNAPLLVRLPPAIDTGFFRTGLRRT